MSHLDEIVALSEDNTASDFALSGETLAVLFYARDYLANLDNWRDNPDEILSDVDIDTIQALVDNAFDELMRPIMRLPYGSIQMWGDYAAPDGWLLCDGSAVSRTTYADLFDAIGVTFGEGDTTTTFNLPDMVDRSPFGVGGIDTVIGNWAGEIEHTLTVSEMPRHDHDISLRASGTAGGTNNRVAAPTNTTLASNAATDAEGGDAPHNNLHPVLFLNFIIYSGVV